MDLDAVVTAVATLVGALGGVWLTQRHAGREAHLARIEARRDAQRRVISELVIAGRAKVARYEFLVPALHKLEDKDLMEFSNTESAAETGRINNELNRTLVQAELLVGDSVLHRAILIVRSLDIDFPDKALGPIFGKQKPGIDGVLEGLKFVYKFRNAIGEVEVEAIKRLRAPIDIPDPAWRRGWRGLSWDCPINGGSGLGIG